MAFMMLSIRLFAEFFTAMSTTFMLASIFTISKMVIKIEVMIRPLLNNGVPKGNREGS